MSKKESKRREDYFRCPGCKNLFNDEDCILDPQLGYLCPNGCEKYNYKQPDYQSPLQYDEE